MQTTRHIRPYRFPKEAATARLAKLATAREELQQFVSKDDFPKHPQHFVRAYRTRLQDLNEDCRFLKHLIKL